MTGDEVDGWEPCYRISTRALILVFAVTYMSTVVLAYLNSDSPVDFTDTMIFITAFMAFLIISILYLLRLAYKRQGRFRQRKFLVPFENLVELIEDVLVAKRVAFTRRLLYGNGLTEGEYEKLSRWNRPLGPPYVQFTSFDGEIDIKVLDHELIRTSVRHVIIGKYDGDNDILLDSLKNEIYFLALRR